jgi:hypothetical protein
MKRLTFILTLALCLALTGAAHAQRQLPGMRGVQVTAGMTDGVYSSSPDNKAGYCFGVGMAIYAKRGDKWVVGAEHLVRNHPYRGARLPVAQSTVEGGYYLKFLSDPSKTFSLSIGGSAMAGYETVNGGVKTLHDGATLRDGNAAIYGGAVTLEAETFLSDRVVLLLTGRERVMWGNTTGRFHTQFGVGLRFMID